MKTIVCFGDSNTWGYMPGTDALRFAPDVRWPGVMRAALGDGFTVIESALNGRTTVFDDPLMVDRNGRRHLPTVLETHAPIDLLIIALGVNDLKQYFNLRADDIAAGAGVLAQLALDSDAGPQVDGGRTSPGVALVCPVRPVAAREAFGHKFDGAVERSADMPRAFAEVAQTLGVPWFDAGAVAKADDLDGVHLDADAHAALGRAMAEFVRGVLD